MSIGICDKGTGAGVGILATGNTGTGFVTSGTDVPVLGCFGRGVAKLGAPDEVFGLLELGGDVESWSCTNTM